MQHPHRSAALILQVALALLDFGICSAKDSQALAAPEAAPQSETAMVQDPCPAAPAVPSVVANLLERTLKPGKPEAMDPELLKNPEVQAYVKAERERALGDWPNLCRYRAANAALTHPPKVVFMGDSITENWAKGDPALFDQDVVDRGISGQTSPQMLVRFFQDVVELKPQVVHIMAGTNDLAGNTGPTTTQNFKDNIMAMVDLAHAHHIRVVLAAIPPSSGFSWKPALRPASMIADLNRWLRAYASQSGSRFVDYHSVLADPHGGFLAALSNDGVHPNRDGYAVMRKLTLPSIGK